MNTTSAHSPRNDLPAFTLIELLVVIAVIAILAALLVPISGALKKQRMIKVAQTELQQVATAIEAYKAKYGQFPPDNPVNPVVNQLYFELEGTIRAPNGDFQTLDGSAEIGNSPVAFQNAFGVTTPIRGFVNFSPTAQGSDEKGAAITFIKDLKPGQVGSLPSDSKIKLLTCSVLWDDPNSQPVSGANGMNPWRYVSSHPTNNTTSFDLWVDLLIAGKTNRISNWSAKVQTGP